MLYAAQKAGALAHTGPYARIRHPQYAAFMLIMIGFLMQWPTLITAAIFPILAVTYIKLARCEETEALSQFGDVYRTYKQNVPGWFPLLTQGRPGVPPNA